MNDYGEPIKPTKMGDRAKRYMGKAGIEATGSCHLLRHATATLMLEIGAEMGYIQAMLGHENCDSTQIYNTHVSIRKFLEIHTATHPADMGKAIGSDIGGATRYTECNAMHYRKLRGNNYGNDERKNARRVAA